MLPAQSAFGRNRLQPPLDGSPNAFYGPLDRCARGNVQPQIARNPIDDGRTERNAAGVDRPEQLNGPL